MIQDVGSLRELLWLLTQPPCDCGECDNSTLLLRQAFQQAPLEVTVLFRAALGKDLPEPALA